MLLIFVVEKNTLKKLHFICNILERSIAKEEYFSLLMFLPPQ